MSSNSGSNLYSQGFGTTSSASFPGNAVVQNRAPTSSDIQGPSGSYVIGQLWVDTLNSSSWQLVGFSVSNGLMSADWAVLGGGSSDVNTLSGDTGIAVPTGGNIEIAGMAPVVTAAGGSTVTISIDPGTDLLSTLTGNTGGAISPTAGNINILGSGALDFSGSSSTLTGSITPGSSLVASLNGDSGTATPSSGVITVAGGAGIITAGSGSTLTVSLTGGGQAIDSVGVDANTPPGTDPVLPDASGLISVTGAQVASHAVGANVIQTNSLSASTYSIQIQQAGITAAKDTTYNGVAHFNSDQFSIDEGFVSLAGAGLAVDSFSPDSGTDPVIPDSSGLVGLKGTGSITTVGSLNTVTTQLTGLTNHNVLVGAGTATITSVPPSSTAGIPVVSNGSSADPSFSTALVVGGGTGSTSFSAYGPIIAGTTSTGALSSVTPSPTSGVPLISQGNSTPPVYGTAVVAGGGTGSTSFNIYGPIVAAATSTGALTSVTPSATTGIPLVSQGSSANPSFSTAVVAGGGTGVTSLTTYAPICGGTTTTGALQSASTGQSTSGFVLTSTGASSLPTWQAASDASAVKTITGSSGGTQSPDGSGNFNILGSGSITTAGTTNTETISLTGLTNHSVLVGAGTATITKVAPSATVGMPFVSGGASADPSFTTAVVAGGGTGQTAFTPYAPVTAGATSTAAFLSANINFSSSGNVLTSNGSGASPSWLPIPSAGSSWIDQSGTFTASSGNNYFITASATATLPASPSQGNSISFIVDTASALVITANTGQIIRIGTGTSSTAGTATSTARGDSLTLVYRSTGAAWICLSATQGTFTLA